MDMNLVAVDCLSFHIYCSCVTTGCHW